MGLPRVTAKITAPRDSVKSYEAVFLVDTGATDSLVPAPELDKIGLRREGKMTYELADGQVREYAYGLARIQFLGEITAGRVIFGDPDCEPLLGVTALESVGIMVDPASKTLRRLPAIPLK
jgi:clan AA aspartic protease